MEFYNQSWFWTGCFTLLASLGAILTKELISNRYQLKLERIKLYETDQFKAYNKLYEFLSTGYSYLSPSDLRLEYIHLLEGYFEEIKPLFLYYQPEIRRLLAKLENQYHGLIDPDCAPEKSLDKFMREDFLDTLNELSKILVRKTDELIHKM